MQTLEQLIGQMLLIGFRETQISTTSKIIKDIQQFNIGGVILFDIDVPTNVFPRNIQSHAQLKKMTAALHDASPHPLFISIDQEGGLVNRLKTDYGFPQTISHADMAALNDDAASQAAHVIAATLADCHINLNFAPCVDLAVNPQNPIIALKQRSFSAQPETVSRFAELFIQAHHEHKIMCAVKHFPGHGSSQADTHVGMADITNSWSEEELQPYHYLLQNNLVDMVMAAHVFHRNLDSLPASLSFEIIQKLLREQMQWQGVTITDDLQMGAIAQHYGFENALELAINAGVDILLLGNNLKWDEHLVEKTIKTIAGLVREQKISLDRLENANERILKLKKKWC